MFTHENDAHGFKPHDAGLLARLRRHDMRCVATTSKHFAHPCRSGWHVRMSFFIGIVFTFRETQSQRV